MEVGAGAREPRVRADPDPDEEITSGGSCAALPALPGGADAGAVRDAGGDGDLDASRATAAAQLNGACRAGVCLLEGDLGGPLDVVATARHGGSSLPGAAGAAEHGVEEVGEGVGVAEHALQLIGGHAAVLHLRTAPASARGREGRRARPPRLVPGLVLAPARADLVVETALLGVAENLVGLVGRLEAALGGGVALVEVRVVLAGELAEGGLDLLLRRRAGDAEDRVIVLKGRRHDQSCTRSRASAKPRERRRLPRGVRAARWGRGIAMVGACPSSQTPASLRAVIGCPSPSTSSPRCRRCARDWTTRPSGSRAGRCGGRCAPRPGRRRSTCAVTVRSWWPVPWDRGQLRLSISPLTSPGCTTTQSCSRFATARSPRRGAADRGCGSPRERRSSTPWCGWFWPRRWSEWTRAEPTATWCGESANRLREKRGCCCPPTRNALRRHRPGRSTHATSSGAARRRSSTLRSGQER